MRVEDLINPIRISRMSHDYLMRRIRQIRDGRVSYVSVGQKKKSTKSKTARKKGVDKVVDKMSIEEMRALLKQLEKDDG